MRRRFSATLAALALATAVLTMSASGAGAPTRPVGATLTATGNGAVSFTPDSASLSFGVSVQKATAAGAIAADAAAMNELIAALKQAGAREVATDALSLSVRSNRDGTAIVGFQATNSVRASAAVSAIGGVIDAAVAAGATNLNGPGFSSSGDVENLYRAALRKAVVQARERAEALADAAGVRLVRIVSIEPGSSTSYAATTTSSASSSTPVLAPTSQVSASVTLVFAVE